MDSATVAMVWVLLIAADTTDAIAASAFPWTAATVTVVNSDTVVMNDVPMVKASVGGAELAFVASVLLLWIFLVTDAVTATTAVTNTTTARAVTFVSAATTASHYCCCYHFFCHKSVHDTLLLLLQLQLQQQLLLL